MIRTKLKFLLVSCIILTLISLLIFWQGFLSLHSLREGYAFIEKLHTNTENLNTVTLELLYDKKTLYRYKQWQHVHEEIGIDLTNPVLRKLAKPGNLNVIHNNIRSSLNVYKQTLTTCEKTSNINRSPHYCIDYLGRLRTQLKVSVKELYVEMWKVKKQISHDLDQNTRFFGAMLLGSSLLISIFIIIAVLPIIRSLATGLNSLLFACGQYKAGLYHHRINISTRDEISKLASALNSMAEHLNLYRNQAPLATIEWDTHFQVRNLNRVAEEMFGYKLNEIRGHNFSDMIVPENVKPNVKEIWKELLTKTGDQKSINENITKDGRTILCEWHNAPMKDRAGQTIGVVSVVLDITEQKRMQETILQQKQEQSEILNSMVDAVISIDESGKVLTFNTSAEIMFGYTEKEIRGRNINNLMPEHFKIKHDLYLKNYMNTGKSSIIGLNGHEVEGKRKNNDNFPMRLFIAELPVGKDGKRRFIGSCFDLTQHRKTEEQLRYAAELAKTNAELKISNNELEAFTYSVSHDLRRPLRAITGFSRILMEDYAEKIDAEEKKLFSYIVESSQEMSQLIDSLLGLSRITRREIHYETVNLSLLAEQSEVKLKRDEPQRKVKFIIAQDVTISADRQLMIVLFDNLIGNAWKFTANKSDAVIEFGTMLKDGKTTYFVRDNGAGFNMVYANKLFLPFQRLHRSDEFEGTGIGLSTVDRIISRHNGRVWAESIVDEGAVIYFQFDNNTAVSNE